MIKIKSYGSLLLLSVVLLAACSKKQIKPKMLDGNEEITENMVINNKGIKPKK